MNRPLVRDFYLQDTRLVAQKLLGQRVWRRLPNGEVLSGKIVETEAYLEGDPACHGFRGQTPRNRSIFGPPGHAYVYISYGMHTMLNLVCAPEGVGEAVLIRGIEPIEGVETMRQNRGGVSVDFLITNGPGKLAQALGLNRVRDDGADVTSDQADLQVQAGTDHAFEMVATTRVGISQGRDLPWRYYIKGSRFISKP